MTRLSADWLAHSRHLALFDLFERNGFQLYYVGGCVRDALIGLGASDIDMATDARPNQMEAMAKSAGIATFDVGKDHGTVGFGGASSVEVTTFREDVATDGRAAKVAFGTSLETDAERRDFTMNALYCDREGAVIDPMDGMDDLTARRIKFIGDPATRIKEDHLRILRFFRFHAYFGDPDAGIEQEGLAACAAHAESLDRLSRERVGAEMRRLLDAPDPGPAVAAMAQSGVLARVMPGADARYLAPLVHLEAQRPAIWPRRAAVLGGEALTDQWRLSKAEARNLDLLKSLVSDPMAIAEVAYRHGAQVATDATILRATIFEAPEILDDLHQIPSAEKANFPVKAADLPATLKGPEIGATLRDLENQWIASGFTLSKSDLLR
ncbi:MAG: CCA tRNA nucleotidyltransferase [Pseudomonadota bacterium]